MKNINYLIVGLVVAYFLLKKKKRKYSIEQSIETLTPEQWEKLTRNKINGLPDIY